VSLEEAWSWQVKVYHSAVARGEEELARSSRWVTCVRLFANVAFVTQAGPRGPARKQQRRRRNQSGSVGIHAKASRDAQWINGTAGMGLHILCSPRHSYATGGDDGRFSVVRGQHWSSSADCDRAARARARRARRCQCHRVNFGRGRRGPGKLGRGPGASPGRKRTGTWQAPGRPGSDEPREGAPGCGGPSESLAAHWQQPHALRHWQPAASLREPAAVQRGELCGFAYANGHWHSRSRDEGNDRAADPPLAVKLRLGMVNKLVKGGNLFCVGQPWPSGL
jgi:hypothetical protein